MVERDPDPEALEKEERIAEAEPQPAPSWMDEDSKRFNLRMFQEWRNQRANWILRQEVTEEDRMLNSRQCDVISQQKDPEVGREKMKRREIFLKAGKEIGRWTLTKETEEASLQDTRQGDVLSQKKEQNCGGEKNKKVELVLTAGKLKAGKETEDGFLARDEEEKEKESLLEGCQGDVLSHKKDTKDGGEKLEKMRKKEVVLKAGKLVESWDLARE